MNLPKPSILIVEDDEPNVFLLEAFLSRSGYNVISVLNPHEAVGAAQLHRPDLILLDVFMPELDGYQVCTMIKAIDDLRDIPVLFLSALDRLGDKVAAFEAGGVDYITKPYNASEVVARVRTHVELRRRQVEIEAMRLSEKKHYEELTQIKDDLLKMVSHDLKNPLSLITGAVGFLQEELEDYAPEVLPRVEHYIEMIERGGSKMRGLILDVLDLARYEGRMIIERFPTPLNEYLQTIANDYQVLAAEKSIQLVLNLPPEDTEVMISPDRFEQVIQNLLSNALKYTGKGGTVELAAQLLPDHVLISIRDTGIGIPEEAIPHLFEKFYRVPVPNSDPLAISGSGLGLAIAQVITEQHGGKISVESKVNKGSTFTISLPHETIDPVPISK